jgi:hypothetical protein
MAMSDNDPPRWERLPGESSRSHAAFRQFREQNPATRRLDDIAALVGVTGRAVRQWASKWDWWDRADAWDDECYRIDDVERLDAIRSMHANHRRAGRAVLAKALTVLNSLDPTEIPPGVAVRLLDLGAKLERQTLIVSVRELQGVEDDESDPWERIAVELQQPN